VTGSWGASDRIGVSGGLSRSRSSAFLAAVTEQAPCRAVAGSAGVIVWELPGRWKAGVLDQLRLLPSMLVINGRLLPRWGRALAAMESNHPAEPHYDLPVVGVEPPVVAAGDYGSQRGSRLRAA